MPCLLYVNKTERTALFLRRTRGHAVEEATDRHRNPTTAAADQARRQQEQRDEVNAGCRQQKSRQRRACVEYSPYGTPPQKEAREQQNRRGRAKLPVVGDKQNDRRRRAEQENEQAIERARDRRAPHPARPPTAKRHRFFHKRQRFLIAGAQRRGYLIGAEQKGQHPEKVVHRARHKSAKERQRQKKGLTGL